MLELCGLPLKADVLTDQFWVYYHVNTLTALSQELVFKPLALADIIQDLEALLLVDGLDLFLGLEQACLLQLAEPLLLLLNRLVYLFLFILYILAALRFSL